MKTCRNGGASRMVMGFTLIELMVVVAVIGVLAAVAIPVMAKFAQKSSQSAREAAALAEAERKSLQAEAERKDLQAAGEKPQPKTEAAPLGRLPDFRSADISMSLTARHDRSGMELFTRFKAAFNGRFVLNGQEGAGQPVRLFFPFPVGTTEARDVLLTLGTGSGREEAAGVVYDKDGIHWLGNLPPGREVVAEVAFVANGGERFIQHLPPSRRTRSLKVQLDLEGVTPASIPQYGLQPTSIEGASVSWASTNLVSDRDIIVEIPEARGPLGKVSLLFRFVGLAVLLFGAGFWYMNEKLSPGRLDNFGWGNFTLLTLTYCLFFVNFAVLGYHGDIETWPALAAAALTSLPLLVLHVSRLIDLRFALTRTLPLAGLTLGLVVNGVYGGGVRDYVFMGAAYIVIAYLALTFPVRKLRVA